jgi:hypothetical protein
VTSDGTTDANKDGSINTQDIGYYEFSSLSRGTYTLSEVQQSPTWNLTYPTAPGTYSITISQDTPTVTGDYGVGSEDPTNAIGNFGNWLAFVPNPSLNITKTNNSTSGWTDTDGSGDLSVGDIITYAYSVQNTGNVALTNITLSDNKIPG